jgi:hypothetical protein
MPIIISRPQADKVEVDLDELVIEIYFALMQDEYRKEEFNGYLFAADYVEGSALCDDHQAAQMIRDKALDIHCLPVATAKLATIVQSLNAIRRRGGFSRRTMRQRLEQQQTEVLAIEAPRSPIILKRPQ